MSWLRNNQFRNHLSVKRATESPPKNCDPLACTESFKNHWQQASKLIDKSQPPDTFPSHDDVIGVVNHLTQMVTLMVVELRENNRRGDSNDATISNSPCLEHLLSNNILEKLFEWSFHTGSFSKLMMLEQINVFELLVAQSGPTLLVHEPFLKPLLKLLESCLTELFPVDEERRLVLLLHQLCITITQNMQLLDLFFSSRTPSTNPRFILFNFLIKFVYREGDIGQRSRDALLLCISMSKDNDTLAAYITDYSEMCPVLATGLNALYSRLPRKLDIEAEDWHCLTPDDVKQVPELNFFIIFLEFCNAVVQVAHQSIKNQLDEFIHNGFLRPVIGPALLQSTIEELTAATAYYDLFLRSTTTSGIKNNLVNFLLRDEYDGQRILNTLIRRINSENKEQINLVTLTLLETLISLNNESVMYELIFRHLMPCTHIMLSQRQRLREVDVYGIAAARLLALSPAICMGNLKQGGRYVQDQRAVDVPIPYGLKEESLMGNYHAYLCWARNKIQECSKDTQRWRLRYDGESETTEEPSTSLHSMGESSGYESLLHKCSPHSTTQHSPDTSASSSRPTVESDTSAALRLTDECNDELTIDDSQSSSNRMVPHAKLPAPDVGSFLEALFQAVDHMPDNGLYLNLRITAIITRLAVYPQPLLLSLLLNHSLVLQPSVRSLIQVLRALKITLDNRLARIENVEEYLNEAKAFLLLREKRLSNFKRSSVDESISDRKVSPDYFSRGDSKRKSLSATLSSIMRRATGSTNSSEQLLETENGSGYRYVRGTSRRKGSASSSDVKETVICAVLIDEWLKELAAVAQEHALFALSGSIS